MSLFLSKSTVGIRILHYSFAFSLSSVGLTLASPQGFNASIRPIEVVQTEKKGFGIRAAAEIRKLVGFLALLKTSDWFYIL